MSLRLRLVLLIIIAALPVLAVQVIHSLRQRDAEKGEIARSALRLAELKSERLASLVELARGATSVMAQLPSVQAGDGPACDAGMGEIMAAMPEFAGAGAFTPEGISFCRSADGPQIRIADRPYFQEVVRDRRFTGSGYIVGRALKAPTMVFVAPALDASEGLRAVVLVAFALERLPAFLGTDALPQGATLELADAGGNLLARLPPQTGPTDDPPNLHRLNFGPDGTATGPGADGISRAYGRVPLPDPARMQVVVGVPTAPRLAAMDARMWRDLALNGAIFGLAALAALVIAETGILRPLKAVQAMAGRFARGELAARARIGRGASSEVGALARSLNEMADAIAARETALAASEEFGRRMLASSRDCVKVLDLDGRLRSVNEHGRELLGDGVLGRPFEALWAEPERPALRAALERARRGEAARFLGRFVRGDGHEMWWDLSVSPITDAQGRPERLLVVSRDMTELKRAEQNRELLLAELDHRVKNTLAAVQSMARRSLGSGPEASAFVDRVSAMATAHGLLSSSRWEGGALRDLLAGILAAHRARIRLDGPEVHLDAQATQSLAVAVHELATNAAQHGALSVPGGEVDLRWTLHQNDGRELVLDWADRGGPAAGRPAAPGFGLSLVRSSLEYELRGTVELDFAADGLRCRMALPLGAPAAAPQDGADLRPPRSGAAPPVQAVAAPAGRRVLVLEDAALVAMQAEAVLAEAGYEVVGPAATVGQAMRLIEAGAVDAAVLDVNLQGETSFPVARALRSRGTPFIFVTGYSNREVFPPELLDAPRLTKPFNDRELVTTLAAAEAPIAPAAEAAS